MSLEQDQAFVEYVLKAIVDHPDDVRVDRTIDEMGVLISVSVNPEDMGKVIGKSGQTAKAVRTLLKVVGAKNDARVNMKIVEPEGGAPARDARSGDDTADKAAPGSDQPADVPAAPPVSEAVEPAQAPVDEAKPAAAPKDEVLNEKSPLDDL